MNMTQYHHRLVASPVGTLRLVASDVALVGLTFSDHVRAPVWESSAAARHEILDAAERELGLYFGAGLRGFSVPLAPDGTEMQKSVWAALAAIPYGETRSYGDIARAVGRPSASRAVGAANGRNPLSLIVPCHRVVGAGGALTGYAGGVDRKRWLLEHERRVAAGS
jgi:methylated-DNA-[protein]-cysteine S-methyltransferase